MNFYLATTFDNRVLPEVATLRDFLQHHQHQLTASWTKVVARPKDDDPCLRDFWLAWGKIDLQELEHADFVLVWVKNLQKSRGGMFWEAGYAAGRQKRVIYIVEDLITNPFVTMAPLQFSSWEEFYTHFEEVCRG